MKVNLVAVQAKTQLNDSPSAKAFHAKIASLMAEAMAEKPDTEEIVVATVEVDGRR